MTYNESGVGRDIVVEVGGPIAVEIFKYFVNRHRDQVITLLREFGKTIAPAHADQMPDRSEFPSVCLVGLGRCGSNIALGVSTLVYKARLALVQSAEKESIDGEALKVGSTDKIQVQTASPSKESPRPNKASMKVTEWANSVKSWFTRGQDKTRVYLMEPVVLVGDLDIDIRGRLKTPEYIETEKGYERLKLLDLSEIHQSGAGNVPLIGQYLAKVILNRDLASFEDKNWKHYHSYLVDSPGLKENQSRLFFFIFSAGGGTGSGMGGEFGLAQQYAYYHKKYAAYRRPQDEPSQTNSTSSTASKRSKGLEQIFSSGIGILPHFNLLAGENAQAIHVNAGRLICKYLAEEWRYSQSDPNKDAIAGRDFVVRPWNMLMLISNNIMRYVEQSEGVQDIDVAQMEKYSNQYVSQQLFNVLSAQALTSDYDENYFKNAGIDIGETIRLDAQDLHISLTGPVAIAYAETNPSMNSATDLNITEVLYRSISLPAFNKETQAIEGISVLPQSPNEYGNTLKKFKENKYHRLGLEDVKFYTQCSSTVTIISIPKGFRLPWGELNKLKVALENIFPNTKLKRYALIIGASPYLSLTTIIGESPCLCEEVLTLMFAYLQRCFAKETDNAKELEEAIKTYLIEKERDDIAIRMILNDTENVEGIMVANWNEVKWTCESKYQEFLPDAKEFVPIDEIRLTVDDVIGALKYVYKVLRHKGVPLATPNITNLVVK
jgi:hypothetical protein